MKKLIKILFLLIIVPVFYNNCMEITKPSIKPFFKLYKFFGVEKFYNLDKELKDWVAHQYGQWWYKLRTFEDFRVIGSIKFNHQGDKVLIGGYDQTQDAIVAKLFDLHGNLCGTFADYIESSRLAAFDFQRRCVDHIGCSRLRAFDFQGQYLITAYTIPDIQETIVKLWDLNGKSSKTLTIDGLILALAFNMQGQIVLISSFEDVITAQWYDNNLNLIRTIKRESPSVEVCCLARLNKQADIALLQFDSNLVFNKSQTESDYVKYLGGVVKWNLNGEDYTNEDTFVLQNTNFISSMAFAPQGDKILTSSLNEIRLWDLNGTCLAEFKHVDLPKMPSDLAQVNISTFKQLYLPAVNLLEFSPDGNFILTSSDSCKSAKLWNLEGKNLVHFPHDEFICQIAFNSQGNMIMIGSLHKANLWTLYQNPTLEQVLLRKLIHLYLHTKKPSKEFQSPECLFKNIVDEFKSQLDVQELISIWYSISEQIRDSFWQSILETIKKFGK